MDNEDVWREKLITLRTPEAELEEFKHMISELLALASSSPTNKKRRRENELMSAAFDAHPLLLLF
ncbi:MAG: hypothetical protein M3114_05030 [Thermoproteota archaeon]|nr:hypothetical protein [Thermoproteota archaeon]